MDDLVDSIALSGKLIYITTRRRREEAEHWVTLAHQRRLLRCLRPREGILYHRLFRPHLNFLLHGICFVSNNCFLLSHFPQRRPLQSGHRLPQDLLHQARPLPQRLLVQQVQRGPLARQKSPS